MKVYIVLANNNNDFSPVFDCIDCFSTEEKARECGEKCNLITPDKGGYDNIAITSFFLLVERNPANNETVTFRIKGK